MDPPAPVQGRALKQTHARMAVSMVFVLLSSAPVLILLLSATLPQGNLLCGKGLVHSFKPVFIKSKGTDW